MAWAALLTGIGASIAANVGHARPDLGPRLLSALAPVALGLVVEVLARVSWQSGRRSVLPRLATVLVGAVAAVASYSHLHGLALRYGESGVVAALLPLSVDGLAAVGALAVVEIGRTNRAEVTSPKLAEETANTSPKLGEVPVDAGANLAEALPAHPLVALHASSSLDEASADRPAVDESADERTDGPDETADERPDLTVVAAAVAAELLRAGRRVSRDTLAAEIRARGRTVSSARASALLRELRAA